MAQSNQNLKFLIALICVQSNSALALLQNQAAFAEYQADFSAPDLPGENLQDEPPAEDSFEQWVESGCVLSAPGPDWKDLLAEQAQKEVAASAYAHGSATLADDTNVEEKHVFRTIFTNFFTKILFIYCFSLRDWPEESQQHWPQESSQKEWPPLSRLARGVSTGVPARGVRSQSWRTGALSSSSTGLPNGNDKS